MKFSFAINTRFTAVMVLVLSFFPHAGNYAHAQQNTVPEDYLAIDHQRCMSGCVPGFGEQTCKPLCDCTVSEFKKQLSFVEYIDLRAQLTRNLVTPEMRQFLDKTGKYCTAELDRKGIEVGQGADAKPTAPKTPDKPEKPD